MLPWKYCDGTFICSFVLNFVKIKIYCKVLILKKEISFLSDRLIKTLLGIGY